MHEIYEWSECTQMPIMDTEVRVLGAYSGLYSARLHWELTLKKKMHWRSSGKVWKLTWVINSVVQNEVDTCTSCSIFCGPWSDIPSLIPRPFTALAGFWSLVIRFCILKAIKNWSQRKTWEYIVPWTGSVFLKQKGRVGISFPVCFRNSVGKAIGCGILISPT